MLDLHVGKDVYGNLNRERSMYIYVSVTTPTVFLPQIPLYIPTCLSVCILYQYTYTYTYMSLPIPLQNVHIDLCMYICIYVYIYIYICIYTNIRLCIYIYTYVCIYMYTSISMSIPASCRARDRVLSSHFLEPRPNP